MNIKQATLRQLDQQLLPLKATGISLHPKQGWVRTIRKALGMTIKQLAKRLNVNASRVVKIETSEIEDAVTLRTLKETAKMLECNFVYAFIPKDGLENTITNRANNKAIRQVKITSHNMDIEDQAVNKLWNAEEAKELADELLRHSWKHLWDDDV